MSDVKKGQRNAAFWGSQDDNEERLNEAVENINLEDQFESKFITETEIIDDDSISKVIGQIFPKQFD